MAYPGLPGRVNLFQLLLPKLPRPFGYVNSSFARLPRAQRSDQQLCNSLAQVQRGVKLRTRGHPLLIPCVAEAG